MTGYARAERQVPGIAFTCEIKSVNARGLDIRMRLPPGYDALEPELRRRIGKALTRGASADAHHRARRRRRRGRRQPAGAGDRARATVRVARRSGRWRAPTLDGILGLKGVLEQHDAPLDAEAEEALQAAIYAAPTQALADLAAARRDEGAQLDGDPRSSGSTRSPR